MNELLGNILKSVQEDERFGFQYLRYYSLGRTAASEFSSTWCVNQTLKNNEQRIEEKSDQELMEELKRLIEWLHLDRKLNSSPE